MGEITSAPHSIIWWEVSPHFENSIKTNLSK